MISDILLKLGAVLNSFLCKVSVQFFFLGACESASCWPYLCVRASSWCQGQHAQNIQQHSCGSHVQGDLLENNYNRHRFNQQSIVINTVTLCSPSTFIKTVKCIYLFASGLQAPNERARLYFLLAWFHAVIQERLRYAPLGWSKKYEFGESDLRSACDTVDTWLDDTAKVRVYFKNKNK